jgi:transcriptional regulator with XRE-family HTH domain
MTTININPELRDYIDPLTNNEFIALEQSILREGCRDAIVLWNDTLIDGHNRYAICQKHALPFQFVQNNRFANVEDVKLWMIDNHLARRSVSGFQRGVLALRKKEIVSSRRKEQKEHTTKGENSTDKNLVTAETIIDPVPVETREEIAKIAGISHNAVSQIEKIRKSASPELVDAVRSGTISINAAATIASLPNREQVIAVAGGKKELQLAAKQIRQSRTNNVSNLNKLNTQGNPEEKLNTKVSLEQENKALKEENEVLKAKIDTLTRTLEVLKNVS